ncbi:phage terminase large subunit [Amphritea sp. HPY]|uniref:phage terminase large subunit n=1 Tax=Amphritea sp. HPY TaxID=3421652 RepID=UPI003D7CE4F9
MQDYSKLEERLRGDFSFFLFMIWKHLQLPDPTPLQYDIGKYLANGPERCIIEAFRGCGKSFVTSAYVIWLLYRDPQIKVMVVSATKERADAFSQFTKRLIAEVDFLMHLAPAPGQRDSLIAFDVAPALTDHSPSVKSASITGQITGSRANVIIADDIEVPGNSYTQDSRDKLANLVTEFDAILKPYDPRTMKEKPRVIYLGTPQTEMSLYNTLRERGYECRIWPLLFPTDKQRVSYKGALAPFVTDPVDGNYAVPGESTEPSRFDMADIEKRRLSYGKAGFALQFMLDTALSDANKYPLKLEDLVVMDVGRNKAPVDFTVMRNDETCLKALESVGLAGDRYYRPHWVSKESQDYTGAVMVIDPSGRGSDETTWCIAKMYAGNIFVPEIGGTSEGYSEKTLMSLALTAKKHKVNMILIESNFGDGMFAQLLRPFLQKVYPCTIDEVRQTMQKEKRIIDTLEPVMMQHKLVIDPKVIEGDLAECERDLSYSCFHQMSRLTADRGSLRHDDRLDALAMAVAYWVEQMDADSSVIEKERQDEEMQKFLEAYVVGYEVPQQQWMETW